MRQDLSAPKVWVPFEHAIYRELTEHKIVGKKVLLALSGGRDSVALLSSLKSTERACRNQILAVYVDHGPSSSPATSSYRRQARLFCEKFCAAMDVPFFCETVATHHELESEEELRKHRYQVLQLARFKHHADFIATAHHADDLLETRVLRLIRGTSSEGLPAILPVRGFLLRPLLRLGAKEVAAYITLKKLSWVEDPSNRETKYLRNWIRHEWLPALEKRQPGALQSLARSLENLAQETSFSAKNVFCQLMKQKGLSQSEFLCLSVKKQMRVLAFYLRSQNQYQFTQNHLKEVLRHLDISKKKHTFKCAGCVWHINAGHFWAEPERETLST